jgi:hypothetical protein
MANAKTDLRCGQGVELLKGEQPSRMRSHATRPMGFSQGTDRRGSDAVVAGMDSYAPDRYRSAHSTQVGFRSIAAGLFSRAGRATD